MKRGNIYIAHTSEHQVNIDILDVILLYF